MDMPTVGAKFPDSRSRLTRYVSVCGVPMLNHSCFERINPVLCNFQPLLVHNQNLCQQRCAHGLDGSEKTSCNAKEITGIFIHKQWFFIVLGVFLLYSRNWPCLCDGGELGLWKKNCTGQWKRFGANRR